MNYKEISASFYEKLIECGYRDAEDMAEDIEDMTADFETMHKVVPRMFHLLRDILDN